ncbi:MAG: XRE family transcriptional regulator [Bacillota bacterium]|jgi:transcriptional regulator with XRE-family HTH domain|nr:MAG: XRE family transcriptional regulator [Bacillota bacterium]
MECPKLRTRRTALTAARTAKGLSIEGLASLVGVSSSLLYKIEEGTRNPSFALMGSLSHALGASVDALFYGVDGASKPQAVAGR